MVYLVGSGMGSIKYISVYGLYLVKNCDVLIYDRLVDEKIIEAAKNDCIKIYAGKSSGAHSMKQSEINDIIVKYGKSCKNVVRLKGGDPFVFGRGGEEAEVLIENNIPFEVVPGITSAVGAAEICGIPVTHRSISQDLHVVTGHTAENNTVNYKALGQMNGTIVFLMGIKNIGKIACELINGGKSENTPTAFIEKAGTEHQRLFKTTLKNAVDCVRENNIEPPAVIVIGQCVNMDLKWNIKSVGIIGTLSFKERLSKRLLNYNVVDLGTLKIKKYDFKIDMDCEYIVLTSRNGVNVFMDHIFENKIDIRRLSNIKFAVIGKGTYDALSEYGIYGDIMPEKYTALELSKALSRCKGKKIILRAEKGSDDLFKYIDNYEDIKIYDIYCDNIKNIDTDYVIFGSSSAVNSYCEKCKIKGKIIAIGEVTARCVEKYGYSPYIANEYSVDGIVKKLEEIENE